MSRLSNKYAFSSAYQMVVNYLESDGVVCNFRKKTYDELATYHGGVGYRKLFTTINDKINLYHDILSCLTGEKRANIYESIPVIDFLNYENTDIVSTYLETDDVNNPLDTETIIKQPVGDEESALKLIEENNKFTINRAVMGFNTAEHFYNTTGIGGSTTNLQVSPWKGDSSFTYKGVLVKKIIDDGDSISFSNDYSADFIRTNILCYKVTDITPGTLTLNPSEKYRDVDDYTEQKESDSGIVMRDSYSGAIVINTVIEPADKGYQSFMEDGELFVTTNNGKVVITSHKDDIFVLIPTTTYTQDFPNKLLFFKSYKDKEEHTISAYNVTSISEDGRTITLDSHLAENVRKQAERDPNAYYYYDNKLFVYSITADAYVDFGIKEMRVSPGGNGYVSITAKGLGVIYKLYVLLFDSYNTDFSASFVFNDLTIDSELPDYLKEKTIVSNLKKYLSIEKEYYSEASGLLNGLFCEPKEYNRTENFSTVKKWKLSNDIDKAADNGVEIDVGSKYNPNHLLYRGNILPYPLATTSSDPSGYNGKAEIFYSELLGDGSTNYLISLFNDYMRDSWISNNYTISSIVTKFDYSNKSYSDAESKLLSGSDIKRSPLIYKDKLTEQNTTLTVSQINDYITSYNDKFRDGELYLNADDYNVAATYSTENRKRVFINNNTTRGMERDASSSARLNTERNISFAFEYTKVYKKNSSTVDKYKDIVVKSINPMELFTRKNENPDTILVYPEFATNFPETVYLMSKNNLGYNPKDAAFFYSKGQNNGQFLAFTVKSCYDFSSQKISKVNFYCNGDYFSKSTDTEYKKLEKEYEEAFERYKQNPDAYSTAYQLAKRALESYSKNNILKDVIRTCYVYVLEPLKIKFDESNIKLYDWKDNKITVGESRVIGTSYPDNYFKVTYSHNDESPVYKLKNPSDINSLIGSTIISNLPKFKTLSGLSSIKSQYASDQKKFLDTFYNFLKDSNTLKKIAKEVIFKIFSEWPISDSEINPVLLSEAGMFLDNLEKFGKLVPQIVESDFEVVVDEKIVTITKKDFEKLLARIENTNSEYNFETYKVNVPNPWSISEIEAKYPEPFEETDTVNFVNTVIQEWLNQSDDQIGLIKQSHKMNRRSFKAIKSVLNNFFGDGDITLDDCKNLDAIFGNNTEPFVNIGETYNDRELSSLITQASNELYNNLNTLTFNACKVSLSRNNVPTDVLNDAALSSKITDYYFSGPVRHFDTSTTDNWSSYSLKIDVPNFNIQVTTRETGWIFLRRTIKEYNINFSEPDDPVTFEINNIKPIKFDSLINLDILVGMSEFIKTSLEGTNTNSSEQSDKFVTCLTDDNPTGRENSLYFRRYNILNSRMNKLNGPLYQAATFLKNANFFKKADQLDTSNLNVYKEAMCVMPIAEMEPMTYLQSQVATATTIQLDGKFYSDKELDALKTQIGSSCVLTCTVCKIKDSCPFYDENEVIKMYCTGIESIDFWIKDNELELLDKDSFKLNLDNTGDGFDMSEFDKKHLPYSDIMRSIDDKQKVTEFNLNELDKVRNKLKSSSEDSSINLNYSKYVQDDLGWLLGGRYGTVEKNSVKDLDNEDFSHLKNELHDYKYLYNALFIDYEGKDSNKDKSIPVIENDSYVDYKVSSHEYNINFEVGAPGHKTKYSGTTRIKIPQNLKLFKNASKNDDVYIVSDDTIDSEGLEIVPVIYLGTVGNLQIAFDLTDDGVPLGVTNENDTKLYAADVAQWCANYYKGCLAEDPIGYTGDEYKDRDQYWMETVYKKINGRWVPFQGRRRMESGYMEPVTDKGSLDEPSIISGHPVVNNYVNFVRRVSIRMYDSSAESEQDRWLIPFVNSKIPLPWTDKTYKQNVEIQKKVLTLMKTNLRLVVVKQYT